MACGTILHFDFLALSGSEYHIGSAEVVPLLPEHVGMCQKSNFDVSLETVSQHQKGGDISQVLFVFTAMVFIDRILVLDTWGSTKVPALHPIDLDSGQPSGSASTWSRSI